MKIGVASHCAIDTITINGKSFEQPGGPALYGSITARKFKADVELFTKFGPDFKFEPLFSEHKIKLTNPNSKTPTTRFKIDIMGADRTLFLEQFCDPIDYSSFKTDGFIVSPIYHEITSETFEKIKNDTNFVFLDPQGFLRQTDDSKKIFLKKTDLNLNKVSAIKVSVDEITSLTAGYDDDSMKELQKRGVEHVLFTNQREISMLVKDRIYTITLPVKEVYDTTGIGDIFSSTFCCTMIKEKDFLWALCFAGGATQAAIESKNLGLDKIPQKGAVETNASYFYNMVKFRQI